MVEVFVKSTKFTIHYILNKSLSKDALESPDDDWRRVATRRQICSTLPPKFELPNNIHLGRFS